MAMAQKQKKTYLDMQPYFFAYGAGISIFSPAASLYQLCKLNPQAKVTTGQGAKLAMRIFPHQTCLKALQMNASTPVKEQLNPWAAFALVGILQGGVYGQSNVFFSKSLNIGKNPSYAGIFRGFGFAGGRDMISQGFPYVLSSKVREHCLDPVWDTSDEPDGMQALAKHWCSVIGTSVFATYLSQGFHNCQITMQVDQSVGHLGAVRNAWNQNGISLLYRGAEARVGLLVIVNILNELVLKKAWE